MRGFLPFACPKLSYDKIFITFYWLTLQQVINHIMIPKSNWIPQTIIQLLKAVWKEVTAFIFFTWLTESENYVKILTVNI